MGRYKLINSIEMSKIDPIKLISYVSKAQFPH
jgi:hypothetical protein